MKHLLTSLILTAAMTTLAGAQPPRGGPPGPGKVEPQEGKRIQWHGTVAGGMAEAKRLQRPVLLVSAAPHCHQVPGVW